MDEGDKWKKMARRKNLKLYKKMVPKNSPKKSRCGYDICSKKAHE
jgi:hypothetical protein